MTAAAITAISKSDALVVEGLRKRFGEVERNIGVTVILEPEPHLKLASQIRLESFLPASGGGSPVSDSQET